MSAYVTLVNLSEQGARTAKDTVKRVNDFEKALQAIGGRKIGAWWTLGSYDLVVIFEAPDDEALMTALLANATKGNSHTVTMRAFGEEEMGRIVAGLQQQIPTAG